jgi:IS30 family transposase
MHRRLPKGKDIDDLSDEEVAKSIEKINNRPRKCLGFKTPNQLFLDVTSLLHWRVEFALCVVSILGMFMYGFV